MGLDHLIPEEQVRARSFALWNSAGCPEGRSEEFWFRAAAELEHELEQSWLVALEERENHELCMPKLPISKPLNRHEAGRLDSDHLQQAA